LIRWKASAVNKDVIYSDDNVIISRNIATIFGKSFQIRLVSSVDIRQNKSLEIVKILLSIIGPASFLFSIFMMTYLALDKTFSTQQLNVPFSLAFIGLFLTIFAIIMWQSYTPRHDLLLVTAGGEIVAMTSEDASYVQKIRVAIEAAMQLQ
jgi:hypothetical protein